MSGTNEAQLSFLPLVPPILQAHPRTTTPTPRSALIQSIEIDHFFQQSSFTRAHFILRALTFPSSLSTLRSLLSIPVVFCTTLALSQAPLLVFMSSLLYSFDVSPSTERSKPVLETPLSFSLSARGPFPSQLLFNNHERLFHLPLLHRQGSRARRHPSILRYPYSTRRLGFLRAVSQGTCQSSSSSSGSLPSTSHR